ncbi:MAG: serine/threonine protein kinase [Proteobacteria bacterium]|nr:serine/threonine protein kinase [Pseudomonadota bacterium]
MDCIPFSQLTPDRILEAVESAGFSPDGRLLALNSFENRVYRIGVGDSVNIVAKFYRAGRWTTEQILEEHQFIHELSDTQIPIISPIKNHAGDTLFLATGFHFSLWPMQPGRTPDLENPKILERIGQLLGRIHAIGAIRPFKTRLTLKTDNYGHDCVSWLIQHHFIPDELISAYTAITHTLLLQIGTIFQRHADIKPLRLHGDCHPGNLLATESGGLYLVDFDDCLMGPAIQDLWMFLSGDEQTRTQQLQSLIKGYQIFHDFNPCETALIEPLRTLRIIHYDAWLARRWDDPAFPINFPWFNTQRYWQDQILTLREQAALLNEPPLSL